MNSETKHILIVDDNLTNLQFTAKNLKEEGYLISLAVDGKSTLKTLEKQTPDLILLDVMMPGMDGFELCKQIKSNYKFVDTPIIFLTAKNQIEDLVEGFKSGGVDYITKPFNKDELSIRVKNHLELVSARKKIMEMNKTRDKLYSILAHDIRSPLSSIAMLIHVLADKSVEPNSEEYDQILADISQSTNSTLGLIENILRWAKVQSESVALSPSLNNLYKILADCMLLLETGAKNKNITLRINADESVMAYFDELTIQTAIRNLIANAIKFTHEKGKIDVTVTPKGKLTEIRIKDTGVGMSAEVISKILEYNEPYTTRGTKNETGTGLGLFVVKDFVLKNNGKFTIESKLKVGTEVIISLPSHK